MATVAAESDPAAYYAGYAGYGGLYGHGLAGLGYAGYGGYGYGGYAAPAYAGYAAAPVVAAPVVAPAPVNYAVPAPRVLQEEPIVEQIVEPVEQWGYKIRY